jgi:hypothetical protein
MKADHKNKPSQLFSDDDAWRGLRKHFTERQLKEAKPLTESNGNKYMNYGGFAPFIDCRSQEAYFQTGGGIHFCHPFP